MTSCVLGSVNAFGMLESFAKRPANWPPKPNATNQIPIIMPINFCGASVVTADKPLIGDKSNSPHRNKQIRQYYPQRINHISRVCKMRVLIDKVKKPQPVQAIAKNKF